MRGTHSELPPELRQLAQVILDRIDPAVRAAAAAAAGNGDSPGRCQQVWCPVCALAALVHGEQHPMLDVIAEHSIALLAVVRAIVDSDGARAPDDDGPGGGPVNGAKSPATGYQHIPINVEQPEI